MNPQKKLEKLQRKALKFKSKMKEQLQELCEQLQYQDGSRFSYNIDRLDNFTEELNNFKILNK